MAWVLHADIMMMGHAWYLEAKVGSLWWMRLTQENLWGFVAQLGKGGDTRHTLRVSTTACTLSVVSLDLIARMACSALHVCVCVCVCAYLR